MMTFQSLMNGHKSAEIRCLYRGELVRRLTVEGDTVEIDAMTVKVKVPLSTPITFEPWCLDRGNMLFPAPGHGDRAKLCTEHDRITFDDGSEGHVDPA